MLHRLTIHKVPSVLIAGLLLLIGAASTSHAQFVLTASTQIYTETADTTFEHNAFAAADVDLDGDTDFVVFLGWRDGGNYDHVFEQIRLFKNNNNSSYTASEALLYDLDDFFASSFDEGFIGFADLTSGNHPDIILNSGEQNLRFAENGGSGSYTFRNEIDNLSLPDFYGMQGGDFNSDGDNDFVLSFKVSTDSRLRLYLSDGSPNNGGWTEVDVDTDNANGSFREMAVGDVDGDGHLDIVCANIWDDQIIWYENANGLGTSWTSHVIFSTPQAAYLELHDLDSDGDLDVVFADAADDDIEWLENTAGNGSAWTGHDIDTNLDLARDFDMADMDGNGTLDMAVVSQGLDSVFVYINNDGTFGDFDRIGEPVNNPVRVSIAQTDNDDRDYKDVVVSYTEGVKSWTLGFDGIEKEIANSTWTLFGIPYALATPANGLPGPLFSDDLSEAYGEPNWVISRYDMASGEYVRFLENEQNGGLPPLIAPGYSYWIKHTEGQATWIDIPTSDLNTASNDADFHDMSSVLPAHNGDRNGYAMMANPYNEDFDADRMSFGANKRPWDYVINGGDDDQELNANLYTWDGSQYVATNYTSKTLSAWEGFWVIRTTGSSGDLDVRFDTRTLYEPPPPPPGQGGQGGGEYDGPKVNGVPVAALRNADPIDIRISAQTLDGNFLDTYNYAGFRAGTLSGYDAFDAIELNPPGAPFVQLYFSHPDDTVATRLANDYRGDHVAEEVWDFDVRTWGLPNQIIELSWSEIEDLPVGYRVELSRRADESEARQPIGYLDEFDSVEFTTGGDTEEIQHFQLRVVYDGVDRLRNHVSLGESATIPDQFGIARAYPNPFNSTLNVDVTLPENESVYLTVYDVTGRQVGTIADGPMTAGTHTLSWSADGLATGVYFVQAHSTLGTAVRKVSLVK